MCWLCIFYLFFFFSSRRRHTRYIGDWSSDVCSSDLVSMRRPAHDAEINVVGTISVLEAAREVSAPVVFTSTGGAIYGERSEERRVGKECRYRWWGEE